MTGVNMKDAIYSGIKVIFPEAQQPSCVQHLKQPDEIQILKMMDTEKYAEREKMMDKKEIMLDIYDQRRGALYEYGLAESLDKIEFCGKLNLLKTVVKNEKTVVQGFSIGFGEMIKWLNWLYALLEMDRMLMCPLIKTT